jgi:hypothetical protein
MNWSAAEPAYFGWLIGSASGLYALVIITLLVLFAPPYRPDVPRLGGLGDTKLSCLQWGLTIAQLPLAAAWTWGLLRVGRAGLEMYAITLALGTIAVFAPILLVLMFTAAQWVGRSSAR